MSLSTYVSTAVVWFYLCDYFTLQVHVLCVHPAIFLFAQSYCGKYLLKSLPETQRQGGLEQQLSFCCEHRVFVLETGSLGMVGGDPLDEVPWWEILHLCFMVLNSATVSQALPSLL